MKVLCFGSVNTDLVYRTDHFVRPGETVSCDVERNLGGKGCNQACALRKAGCDVYLAGNIGPDADWIEKKLDDMKIDRSLLRKVDVLTGNAIIQVDRTGQNSILLFPGANRTVDEKQIESVLDNFSSGDWLVLQNEVNSIDRIICEAGRRGMRICLNPAPFDDSVFTLPLSLVDLLVVNEIEGASLAEMEYDDNENEIINTLRERYPSCAVLLTLGEKGAIYSDCDITISQPAIKTEVVDTTAAGDTFIGYFLASRIRGYDIERSLYFAAKASSIAVSARGASVSVPTCEKVFF